MISWSDLRHALLTRQSQPFGWFGAMFLYFQDFNSVTSEKLEVKTTRKLKKHVLNHPNFALFKLTSGKVYVCSSNLGRFEMIIFLFQVRFNFENWKQTCSQFLYQLVLSMSDQYSITQMILAESSCSLLCNALFSIEVWMVKIVVID